MTDSPPSATPEPPEADAAAMQAEIDDLRRRNAELAATPPGPHGWVNALRATAVVLLIVLGTVSITAAVPAIWGRNLILNTDRYVETLKPLASDPGVQAAIVKAVDQQFTQHVNITGLVHQALPGRAGDLLATPLNSAAGSLVNTIATKFVQSDAFVALWTGVNRAAHSALVAILTGKHPTSEALSVQNGILTLNLGPIIEGVKTQLVQAGLTVASKVPAVGVTIQVAQVKGLTRAQNTVSALNRIANWLPLLALVFFAAAIVAARRRRRALVICSLATACGMLVIAIGLLIGRRIYLSDLPLRYLTASDAGNIFDTMVRFLRTGLRIVFVVALLICLFVWLTGRSRQARAVRSSAASGVRSITSHWPDSKIVAVTSANHGIIAGVIVGIGALILVLWTNPTPISVITIALITAVLVLLVYSVKPTRSAGDPSPGSAA
jgi:hypothetical protein